MTLSLSTTSLVIGSPAGVGIQPVAPANVSPPTIRGTAKQGETLTADPGAWSGFPAPTFVYQWNRDGEAIANATDATLVLTAPDVGKRITVDVRGVNVLAGSSPVRSAATAIVVALQELKALAVTGDGFDVDDPAGTTFAMIGNLTPGGVVVPVPNDGRVVVEPHPSDPTLALVKIGPTASAKGDLVLSFTETLDGAVGSPKRTGPFTFLVRQARVLVASNAAFEAALKAAVGGERIKLRKAGGPYTTALNGVAPGTRLMIESEDPADPATIQRIAPTAGGYLTGWRNVTIQNVVLDRRTVPYATSAISVALVALEGAEDVTIAGVEMLGRAVEWWPGNTNPTGVVQGEIAIRLKSCKRAKLLANRASGFSFWLQSVGMGQDDLLVDGNDVRRCQKDYVHVGGGGNRPTIRRNYFGETLGSLNEYQTDSGNHDDLIQFWTTGSTQAWVDVLIEDNVLDTHGGDGYQPIFLGNEARDEGGAGEEMNYLRPIARRNRIFTNQANGIAIKHATGALVEDNTVLQDLGRTQTDPQVPFALPSINIRGPSTTATVRRNIAPVFAFEGTITANDNVVIDYANPYGSASAERLFPGCTRTDKTFAIAGANTLPETYPAGEPTMKVAGRVLPAIRDPAADFDLSRELAADPLFGSAANFVRVNVAIANARAAETHASGYWGVAPIAGIAGPRTVLALVRVEDPAAGEFLLSAFDTQPSAADLVNVKATNRPLVSAPRKQGSGWSVQRIEIPEDEVWWPAIQGVGALASTLVFSRFSLFDITAAGVAPPQGTAFVSTTTETGTEPVTSNGERVYARTA